MDVRLRRCGLCVPLPTYFSPHAVEVPEDAGQSWTVASEVIMGDTYRTGRLAAADAYSTLSGTAPVDQGGEERVDERLLAQWASQTAEECRCDKATVVVLMTDNRLQEHITHLRHTGLVHLPQKRHHLF